jgi:hypothetical protein
MEDGGGAGRRSWSDRAEEAEESALDPGYIYTVLGCIHIHCTSIHHVYVHVLYE